MGMCMEIVEGTNSKQTPKRLICMEKITVGQLSHTRGDDIIVSKFLVEIIVLFS